MDASTLYELVRVLHVSADIVFISGLLVGALVLAALSAQAQSDLDKERRLVDAVRRFNRAVTSPALAVVWLCGIWLALCVGWFASHWLQAKLVLVVALSAMHGNLSAGLRRACAPVPVVPSRAWRATPVLAFGATAIIVGLALMKPL